jgi:hypothetical protein
MEYFNQGVTFVWSYHMYIFTDFVPDAETRFAMGYVLIAIVSICFIVNLFPILLDIPYRCRKCKHKRKLKAMKKAK